MMSLTLEPCALCGQRPAELIRPPRRTLDRGVDPNDNSYSITVMLPDVALCSRHAQYFREGDFDLGWCDDPRCRTYGEVGELSACSAPYATLASGNRSRHTPKNQRSAIAAKERK